MNKNASVSQRSLDINLASTGGGSLYINSCDFIDFLKKQQIKAKKSHL